MTIVYEMEYIKGETITPTVALVPYTPGYKERYKRMYNECYREMRQALDIKPYDYIQDDSFFSEGMDQVYLLVGEGGLIGSVALKGSEIDDLLVDKRYQGKGCGKKILLWALANMPEDRVILHVAKWNARAVSLYEKTGFKIVKTMEIP